MENQLAVVPEREIVRLGSLDVSPNQMIAVATEKAKALASVIEDRKLFTIIQGRKYVRVEGWSTLGAMLGVLPRETDVKEIDGDVEATVELIRVSDGAVVGRGSAIVGSDEKMWAGRPRYARRSMAITRATGKAYRLGFSWIISLAGYEPTPAEEIEGLDHKVVDGEFNDPKPAAKQHETKAKEPELDPSQITPSVYWTLIKITQKKTQEYGQQLLDKNGGDFAAAYHEAKHS